MSGVSTGTTPVTTATLPNEIRKGLPTRAAEPREVDPGGTRSRSPAPRRDRVFRQSSNTPITVSESRDPQTHESTSRLASKTSFSNAHDEPAETEKRELRKVTYVMPIGVEGQAAGEIAGPFRGPRATDGSQRVAARRRCQRRSPDTRPGGARPIAIEKWFRRSCRAENGGKKQRSESGPAETSFPALARRATPIPSVRGPRRKRLNESSADLRINLHASNRVTCGGGNMNPFRPSGILPLRSAPGPMLPAASICSGIARIPLPGTLTCAQGRRASLCSALYPNRAGLARLFSADSMFSSKFCTPRVFVSLLVHSNEVA
jgi:hypothetical protein